MGKIVKNLVAKLRERIMTALQRDYLREVRDEDIPVDLRELWLGHVPEEDEVDTDSSTKDLPKLERREQPVLRPAKSFLPQHFHKDLRFCANSNLLFRALLRQSADLWATAFGVICFDQLPLLVAA